MDLGTENFNWHISAAVQKQDGDWLQDKKNELTGTEKRGLFGGRRENSAKYNAIIQALNLLDGVLNESLDGDETYRQTALRMTFKGYQALLYACDNYLKTAEGKARSAKTDVGKERLRIVAQIHELAQNDVHGLMVQRFQSKEVGAHTVREALGKARTRRIDMKKSDAEHEHAGGNASVLTILSKEENGGKQGYFKPGMKLSKDRQTNVKSCFEIAASYSQLPKEKLNQVLAVLGNAPKSGGLKSWALQIKETELYSEPGVKEFVDRFADLCDGTDTSKSNIFGDNLVNVTSDDINLDGRNVATSRMASILGVDRLAAKSEQVEVYDPSSKQTRTGNLMEESGGKEALKRYAQIASENGIDKISNRDKYKEELHKVVLTKAKGGFQRDMADLQVFDYICGQIDRHSKNYFIHTDLDGNFIGVTGIDNDLAFGDAQVKERQYLSIGNHGRSPVDKEGNLIIPHMSREFANSINLLDESYIRYALKDLIEKPELDACIRRFRIIKKAVQKELAKKPEESRLLKNDEWGDNTLNDFINQRGMVSSEDGKGTSNYVGNALFTGLLS